jgi:ribosome recycling factor
MEKEIMKEARKKMKDAVEATRNELASLRTGKASLAILESVRVDSYGSKVPLNQVCTLSVPEPRMILAQPFDPKQIAGIERAILEANIGLNPSNNGRFIRIPVPALTEERRRDLCRRAREIGEKGKISVRLHRQNARSSLEKLTKDSVISETNRDRYFDNIQEVHDQFIEDISSSVSKKETDIMEV